MDTLTPALQEYFGDSFAKVKLFYDLLVREGEKRGLIGPRELPRLWTRHILNSAGVPSLITQNSAQNSGGVVLDVGSGAGFPGVITACMLPNYQIYLLDAMQRRTEWLEFACSEIGLNNVTVVRGRAEDVCKHGMVPPCDYVTARAVAPLKKLLPWTAPFLAPNGTILALKGKNVATEIEDAKYVLKKYKLATPEVVTYVPPLNASDVSQDDITSYVTVMGKL